MENQKTPIFEFSEIVEVHKYWAEKGNSPNTKEIRPFIFF
jgi:hypothetical protein